MKVDNYGIIRSNTGEKVAVFRDPQLATQAIDRLALLTPDQAAAYVANGNCRQRLEHVHLWRLVP